MDAQTRIRCYAILTAMHEKGYDYVQCLVPVVLQFIPYYDFTDIRTIKHELDQALVLPELTLREVLEAGVRDGHIMVRESESGDLYQLRMKSAAEFVENRERVGKNNIELFQDMRNYFINKGVVPDKGIPTLIEEFISTVGFGLNFLGAGMDDFLSGVHVNDTNLQTLVSYLSDKSVRAEYHHTFKEYVKGYIIAKALEWTDLHSAHVSQFTDCELFLDTNYLFSILDLHQEQINTPARELFQPEVVKPNETVPFQN